MGKWPRLALVSGGLILADQLTKLVATKWLEQAGDSIKIIPGLFDLTYVLNTGVAFGLMSGNMSAFQTLLLIGLTLLVLALILILIHKTSPEKKLLLGGLSLVSGGALANLADRVRLGAVVDFLDFHLGSAYWPVFNLADTGITIGTILILVAFWMDR
ncbi:MAG: signal peptidase II [Deltaproteobacteria bacterium]|nr:signal peptidase II [Deltaproteobacteria bacterium]MBW2085959.1 signal peptidase II [Deltaproteobacteria bacterium]